jgi:hypothetical protein
VCGENGFRGYEAMEVDRVSQMGGVRPERISAWPQREKRRRKFVEEVPESEAETEEREATEQAEPAEPAKDRATLDVMA